MGNDYSVELNVKNAAEVTAAFEKVHGKKLQIALIDDDEMCLTVAKHKLETLFNRGLKLVLIRNMRILKKAPSMLKLWC
ncbi:MAG: hypothetical protein ACO3EE_11845 [Flavobacteriales bacterium]